MSFFLALIVLVSALPFGDCSCIKATDSDVPQGANELIEYSAGTKNKIRGTISLPDGTPAGDAVVELYEIPKTERDAKAYEFVRGNSRRDACITASDGSFCFSDVPSGKYLLRAGNRGPGWNEVFVHVAIDRRWLTRWWFGRSKPIQIELSLGS